MDADRMFGTVKWFSRIKGYGFIAPDGQDQEIFVHFSGIEGEGYRNLEKGQRVSFQVEETEKGPQAVGVRDQMVDEYTPGAEGMGGVTTFEPDDESAAEPEIGESFAEPEIEESFAEAEADSSVEAMPEESFAEPEADTGVEAMPEESSEEEPPDIVA